jgi:predicted enzyme involved in methoxymalonyl-ACP biosynthesis
MESAMLDELVRHALDKGMRALIGRYVPSAKNGMVAGLLPEFGFVPLPADEHPGSLWLLDISGAITNFNRLIEVNQ